MYENHMDMKTLVSSINKKLEMIEPVLECMEEGIEVADEHGNIIYMNQKFIDLSDIDPETRLSQNIFDTNPSGILAQVLRERQPVLNAVTTMPGKEGTALVSSFPLYREGKFIGAVIIVKDVSQTVRLSKIVNQQESYLAEFYRQSTQYLLSDIVARDERMQQVLNKAREASQSDGCVVIEGEPGTGKDMLAEAIHSQSSRNKKPFFKFDCAKYSESEAITQLFGYEKNAFPEAFRSKVGLLELVDGGTLYFDHFDELSLNIQSRLVQCLKEKRMFRIGGTEPIPIEPRILVSTNSNLEERFENGFIHEDFFRIFVQHHIRMMPLRERTADIPDLIDTFIKEISSQLGKNVKGIARDALELMLDYSWPGNIKELKNLILCAVVKSDSEVLSRDLILSLLPFEYVDKQKYGVLPLKEMERRSIIRALEMFGTSLNGKKKAAEALQISLGTLYNKMREYGL